MLCETKSRTGKNLKQDCCKRNLVYETRCQTCEDREIERIEKDEKKSDEEKKRMKDQIKIYKYVGETARSVYERSREHQSDMEQLKPCSHLLKHVIDQHENEDPDKVQFSLKVLNYCKSSFERQIMESVTIQKERHHNLLNSKAEYNRSAVPRLTTKIGEKQYKKWEKETEKDVEKNERLEEKIRNMRKMRNKSRRNPIQRDRPAGKRRKISGERYQESTISETRPEHIAGEKRRGKDEEEAQPRRKRMRQMLIGEKIGDDVPRYKEFGEQQRWEFFDWEGKMREYEKDMLEKEKIEKRRKEKAAKLEKGWELMRLCKAFIEENSKAWKDEEESRRIQKDEEEKKMERLREAARKKGRMPEEIIQRKISEIWKTTPRNEQENLQKEEDRKRRKDLRNVKENL